MATYFHGSSTSEIQSSSSSAAADHGLHAQTLHLMNPNYVPYPDTNHHNHNMLLLNNLHNFHHAPPPSPHNHHHVIHGSVVGGTDDVTTAAFHAFSRPHYNLWGPATDQPPSAATTTQPISTGGGAFRWPSQQGLSLSLSSKQTANYRPFSGELDVVRGGTGNSPTSVVFGSRYLKGAQELLDEVVNVGRGIFHKDDKDKMKANRESTSGAAGDGGSSGGGDNSGGAGNTNKHVGELSTAQRQELQMKKSKLVTMLDEVDQRYRQYHHQMQIVISSFEQAAGFGSAKSYTALALKTISKQFRCLKDAISAQIKATSKSLGEDDCLGVKVEGSRLRFVDHHLRQQRALQQLGMVQPNAWRPQRGLPERAVSVLRAWLFEHFLHPYPKDSDKIMLAKQTGLARSQVSNWFINARVRLWKPMVEEMYMEEIKEQEKANGSDNTRSKESSKELGSSTANNVTPESGEIKLEHIKDLQSSKQESFNTSPTTEISTNSSVGGGPFQSHSGFHRNSKNNNSPSSIISVDMEMNHGGGTSREAISNTRFGIERHHKEASYPALMTDHSGGFGSLFSSMEDMGSRFNVTEQLASRFHGNNNGVSLTLGLHHNENLPNISGTHQHGFLSQNIHLGMGLEMGSTNGNEVMTATDYDSIDIQNRKRFAAQLLPDFCGMSG